MEIGNYTGITKTPELQITKSIESFIISMTQAPELLSNETITIYIERVNKSNVYLATSVKLSAFLDLTNYHAEALQSDAVFHTIGLCQLSPDGAIQLNEGDLLKFKLEGLKPTVTYQINTVEDFYTTNNAFSFERKSMGSDEVVKTIIVENALLGTMNLHPTLKDITFVHSNGSRVKMTPFELVTQSRDVDPVYHITSENKVKQGNPNSVTFPLLDIVELEIVKDAGAIIEVFVKNPIDITNA